MPKFLMAETIHSEKVTTARLGGETLDAAGRLADTENGKIVKLVAESRYDLAAATDAIEGFVSSVAVATYDGFALGGVVSTGTKAVVFSGATVAVGDYVVTGTVTAKGTTLGTANCAVAKAADQVAAKAAPFKWRVVSLGTAGTGVAGTTGLIERV